MDEKGKVNDSTGTCCTTCSHCDTPTSDSLKTEEEEGIGWAAPI